MAAVMVDFINGLTPTVAQQLGDSWVIENTTEW